MSAPVPVGPMPEHRPWPARLWVGVLVLLTVLAMLLIPPFVIERDALQYKLMMVAPALGVIGACVWWSRLSRVSRPDRIGVVACFLLPFALFVGEIVIQGVMPMAPGVYGVPFVLLLWIGWLVVSYPLGWRTRRIGTYTAVLLGWAAFGMVRLDQTEASMVPNLSWRWTPRPEDAFLAQKGERGTTALSGEVVEVKPGDWAEFRGPSRDNTLTGINLDPTRFTQARELWKVPIGPGWGSFAVVGERLYTLEQQGDREAVVCLDAKSGKMVWEHTYPAKFYDPNAGVGPRSTPTVTNNRVYTLGATGLLKCLNAVTGGEIWAVDLTTVGGVRPMWGFASSPLVTDGKVVVFTNGGKQGKATAAFDADSGQVVWQAGRGWHGYSSGRRVAIAGIDQILMASNYGLESHDPATGRVLWEHQWIQSDGNRSAQPAVIGEGDYLLGTGVGFKASRRLKVTKTSDGWDVAKVWESRRVSPYFNDGVVFEGHYYGFSGDRFHCIDLADGQEKWDASSRYGNGQVLLLADQGLLIVSEENRSVSEVGSVFLLQADSEDHTEVASFPTIKGKTWNHPVIAHGRLYVRNGVEAACYELPTK